VTTWSLLGKRLARRGVRRIDGAFPAIEALAGSKKLKAGLDAAIIEFLTSAGLTPHGKVWLRDGRTGETLRPSRSRSA
jgi:DNA-directed RNA polymerase beta subunit